MSQNKPDPDKDPPSLWEQIAIFSFGIIFVILLIVLAVAFPEPSQFQYTVFRIILALAAAGIAALIPGFIEIKYEHVLRAGGALGVFAVVYFFSPAGLVAPPSPVAKPLAPLPTAPPGDFVLPDSGWRAISQGEVAGLSCGQLDIALNEIYARRGRYFQRANLQSYFAKFTWYKPSTWDPDLTGTEQNNVALISHTATQNGCRTE